MAETCGECHKKKLKQHRNGKHNLGWLVMKSQIAWHGQPVAITEQGYRGCSGCHKIGEKSLMGVTDGNTVRSKATGTVIPVAVTLAAAVLVLRNSLRVTSIANS